MEDRITKGLLHNHTEHSLMDSTMSPEELVETAGNLGAPAIALTDHGTMTGIIPFKRAVENYNKVHGTSIKAITGVEAYIAEDPEESTRLHLILMARDKIGETAIGKFVTATNTRVKKVGKLRFPLGNKELLSRFFGEGSVGHGHVVATSACVGGVLAGLNFLNEERKEERNLLEKNIKSYKMDMEAIEKNNQIITRLNARIKELSPYAARKFGAKEKALKKLEPESKDYRDAVSSLAAEKNKAQQAAMEIRNIKSTIAEITKKNTDIKKHLNKMNNFQFAEEKMERYTKLNSMIKSEGELIDWMFSEAAAYNALFGHGNFFIEVQYHGLMEEKKYMHHLADIAKKLAIPFVAANDAHMAKRADLEARETITSLRFNKLEKLRKEDEELYIKTDRELFEALSKALGSEDAGKAIENISLITDMCEIKGEHYPVFKKGADAGQLLRQMVYERIPSRYTKEEWTREKAERAEYELGVIIQMGYADYHLIVQDFINFGKKLGKVPEERLTYLKEHIREMTLKELISYVEKDQTGVGYVVGPGRGSAAGSLVCYILGITNIDPLKYGLLFERFLNPERVTMPDIDTDFTNGYRELVIEYVSKKYGENAVCRIVTFGTQAARGSIRAAGRILGAADESKAEIYNDLADRLARKVQIKPHATIKEFEGDMKEITASYPEAEEIVRRAEGIEGTATQYGMHAAGVIISDNADVSDYVPLMLDEKSGNWKCQCDMVEAENIGLLKMDFLGLRNLNIITETLRKIWKNRGIKIDPDKDIKIERKVIKAICAAAKTNSIFQFESGGMKKMLMKFVPDSLEDLILLVAAYRPGPMDYIPGMIEVKHGRSTPSYVTPLLEPILGPTYGSIIYQEQVQKIFQVLAGYSLGQADLVRRAMSKKKEKVIMAEKESFLHGDAQRGIKGCVANGIPEEGAEKLFGSIVEFAKYAFNKSHAAAYATVSYITAWLKYYYPVEYLSVCMENADIKKIPGLIEECKSWNISIEPVDINKSDSTFLNSDHTIRFGLTSIKGIGNADILLKARQDGYFRSVADYMIRGHFDKTVTNNLIQVGAFDRFCPNRKALLLAVEEMAEYKKAMVSDQAKLETAREKMEFLKAEVSQENALEMFNQSFKTKLKKLPTMEAVEEQIQRYKESIAKRKEVINTAVLPVEVDEDYSERLETEKKLLGIYLTGHPLDQYVDENVSKITDIASGDTVSIMGIIKNLRIVKTKRDQKDMAFFEIEDKTDSADVVCFNRTFEKVRDFIKEGNAVVLKGKVEETQKENITVNEDNEEEIAVETVIQILCNDCSPARKKMKDLILEIPNIVEWVEKYRSSIKSYAVKQNGYRLVLHDRLRNEFRTTNICVNPAITEYYDCYVV